MKSPVLLAAVIAANLGCEKADPVLTPPTVTAPTTIVHYTDLSPDVSISSVRAYTSFNLSCDYPVPLDSIASGEVDVDRDSVADFQVIMSHSLVPGSCSTCGKNFKFSIDILPLHAGASVCVRSAGSASFKPFSSGSLIKSAEAWSTGRCNIFTMICKNSLFDVDRTYCGIVVNGRIGWISFHKANSFGCTLSNCAINFGNSGEIRAGQSS